MQGAAFIKLKKTGRFKVEERWDMRNILGRGPLPETVIAPIDGAEMVLVPAGEFTMGMGEEEIYQIFLLDDRENPVFATEIPARREYLDSYYIDRYPVTNYQYRRFIESTGHRQPMLINHPEWD